MTSSISAQSATVRAIGPFVANPPRRRTSRARRSRARASACDRRRRSRPPGCGSSRRRPSPARACRCRRPSAAPAPPLEPPGVRVMSCGLRVGPKSAFSVVGRAPISGVLVLPISTAPARRRRAMQAASDDGRLSANATGAVGGRIRRRVVEILGGERDAVQRPAPDVRQAVALARLCQGALAVPGDDRVDARILRLELLERRPAGLLGGDLATHEWRRASCITAAGPYTHAVSFRDDSQLDPSEVRDERGRGGLGGAFPGGRIAVGGGGLGLGGIVIILLLQLLGGGGGLGQLGGLQDQTWPALRPATSPSAAPAPTPTRARTAGSSPTSTPCRSSGRTSSRAGGGPTPRPRRTSRATSGRRAAAPRARTSAPSTARPTSTSTST